MRGTARYNRSLVTRTPPEPPEEELDELDDEAIVAQQSMAHAPQRRAQIKVESRSVVVADEDAEATRQLQAYTEGTSDPTLVVRGRQRRALSRAVAEMDSQETRKKSWTGLAIWGAAGLLAFGLGAILATLSGKSSKPAVAASAAAAANPSPPVAPSSVPVATVEAAQEHDAAPPVASAEPAVKLDQLPVEKHHVSRPRAGHATRPAAQPHAKPARPTQPAKGAIPSGI